MGTFVSYLILLQQIKQLVDSLKSRGGSAHIHGRADVTIMKGRCDGKMTFEMTGNKNVI
jgi:hypothetical protein